MGFSRQEHWSGLPCPPPGHLSDSGMEAGSPAFQEDSLPSESPGKPLRKGVCVLVTPSCVNPWTVAHQAPPSKEFSRKHTGVGCRFLLQGLFPTQESRPGFLHYRRHQGSPIKGVHLTQTSQGVLAPQSTLRPPNELGSQAALPATCEAAQPSGRRTPRRHCERLVPQDSGQRPREASTASDGVCRPRTSGSSQDGSAGPPRWVVGAKGRRGCPRNQPASAPRQAELHQLQLQGLFTPRLRSGKRQQSRRDLHTSRAERTLESRWILRWPCPPASMAVMRCGFQGGVS